MTLAITIRPALPADSALVARLVYLTMGIEADWLFGQEQGHSTLQVLAGLHRRKNNRLSYRHAHLAECDGQPVGLLISFPGGKLSRLDWLTGWCLLQIIGLSATIRLARIQSAYGDLKETGADEFYISNLAVFPGFEGQGIGSRLMAYAEDLARASGLQKCSLIVAFGHENACRLYERLGYQVVHSYLNGHQKVAEGSGGYHKMVKILRPPQGGGRLNTGFHA
jgi:ribosomal protein S18 acetylase RimI-like enzyme